MKIATWNVNSLRLRLAHLQSWLQEHQVDVVCLQETKVVDADFPIAAIEAMGYEVVFSGQKSYNGVAILCRKASTQVLSEAKTTLAQGFTDEARRQLALTVQTNQGPPVRIWSVYVPNGQAVGSDKYEYKLRWLQSLHQVLQEEVANYEQVVVAGDYNIAPTDADVWDPKVWQGQILCSEAERAAFTALLDLGFVDALVHTPPQFADKPRPAFTWWDYRDMGFRRGLGLRIDHVLLSHALQPNLQSSHILRQVRALEKPSDHAPVVVDLMFSDA